MYTISTTTLLIRPTTTFPCSQLVNTTSYNNKTDEQLLRNKFDYALLEESTNFFWNWLLFWQSISKEIRQVENVYMNIHLSPNYRSSYDPVWSHDNFLNNCLEKYVVPAPKTKPKHWLHQNVDREVILTFLLYLFH